ncbi:Hypp3963, partial [Branchiostoma lanceolatum]
MATVTEHTEQRAVTTCTQTDFQSEEDDEDVTTASEERIPLGQDVGQDAEEVAEDVAEELEEEVSDEEEKEEEEGVALEGDEEEDAPTEISLEIHVRKIQRIRQGHD